MGERGVRAVLASAVCAALALLVPIPVRDWPELDHLAGFLGLSVYVEHPSAQVGPLGLAALAVVPGEAACALVISVLLGPAVWLIGRGWWSMWAVLFWWPLATSAHVEDAAVIVLLLVALRYPRWAAVALGTAMGWKPWAVFLAPILLAQPRRLRAFATFAAVTAAWWLPFVVAEPGTLGALEPTVGVRATSLAGMLGQDASAWWRAGQLGVAAAACAWCARRGRLVEGALAACAIRVGLEPGGWIGYYLAPVGVLAVAVGRVPTVLAAALWVPWEAALPDQAAGVLRLTVVAVLVGGMLRTPVQAGPRAGDERPSTPGQSDGVDRPGGVLPMPR